MHKDLILLLLFFYFERAQSPTYNSSSRGGCGFTIILSLSYYDLAWQRITLLWSIQTACKDLILLLLFFNFRTAQSPTYNSSSRGKDIFTFLLSLSYYNLTRQWTTLLWSILPECEDLIPLLLHFNFRIAQSPTQNSRSRRQGRFTLLLSLYHYNLTLWRNTLL